MNETAERVWGAGLLMRSPAWLIDRLLDTIEDLREVLMPAQVRGFSFSCPEIHGETNRD